MKSISISTLAALTALSLGTTASAQTAGNLLGAPLTGVGAVVSGAAAAHHAGPAQVVNGVSPTLAPATDGVTSALAAVGQGVTATGQGVQANGVVVGTQAGQKPLLSVGTSNPASQGSLVSALNGHP